MTNPRRGEVWLVDLGMAAKIRPCLVISVGADQEKDRVLVTVIAPTTSARGSRFEVPTRVRFLKPGAFDVQNLITIPHPKLIRRLGNVAAEQLTEIEAVLRLWLGLNG